MENWRIFAVDGKRCAARRRGKRRRQSINRGDTRVDGFTEIFVVKGLDFKEAAPIQRERLLTVRENSGRREACSGSRESPLAITIEEYFSRWDSWNGRTEGKFSKQSGWRQRGSKLEEVAESALYGIMLAPPFHRRMETRRNRAFVRFVS